MNGFDIKKSVQALNFFTGNQGEVQNKMKALKLVWLSDRLHLRKFGRTITGDSYVAMKNGPVASQTRDILEMNLGEFDKKYPSEYLDIFSKYDYRSLKGVDRSVFSKTDTDAMQIIFDKYASFTEWGLSDLSHEFAEWKRFGTRLFFGESKSFPIEMEDFFDNYEDGRHVFVDSAEDIEISREIFKMNESIKRVL